jgi:xylulokinase
MSPAQPLFVGIDAGTSACKAVLVDADLAVRATSWCAYPTTRTHDGAVTQEACDWLSAVEAALSELADACDPAAIAAIGLTAPAHNVVLVGADGVPLAPVILWSDTRSAEVASELQRLLGDTLRERAFVRLGPAWTLPQLTWLHAQRPELWPRVRWVLPGKDFIRFRMTGDVATDRSDAAGTAMYDQRADCWIAEAIDATALSADVLPPVVGATELGGGLSEAWSRRTGVPQGTPVAVGATDTAAELVALGASEPRTSLVKIASTGTVVAVSSEPRPDPRVLTYPHPLGNLWYTVAATNTAATAYTWLRGALFEADAARPAQLYEVMNLVASEVEPGAGGVLFLPFLEGERSPFWDPYVRAAFLGLSSWHSRPHLCRSVLEGVALSLRSCRDLLAELGLQTRGPRLAGGGTASEVWVEILLSTLGEEGVLVEPQGPALGAAMLGGIAVGALGDALAPRSTRTMPPRADWLEAYDRLYDTYRRACELVRPISRDLVALGRTADPLALSASR